MALFLFERRKTVATWTYADGEAKRKDFMVFWITDESTTNITKDKLEIIGKGVEDMPISMNPETEEIGRASCRERV